MKRNVFLALAFSSFFYMLNPWSNSWARSKQKTLGDVITDKVNEALISVPKDQEVCFSPEQNCDVKLWKFIHTAEKSLDVAIYDLTHVKIAHEIMAASKKIPVRVVVDRRQSKGEHSLISLLVKAGVSVKFGTQRGIMHNKFVVLDGKMVETGSFNYTDGASFKNNENQIYLANPSVVQSYHDRFETLWAKGTPVETKVSAK